jgi:acetate---CoA ligase (ADP-forming) subunit beta
MQQFQQDKALSLLAKYKIPLCRSHLLTSERLKGFRTEYPVVLKTAAPEVVHKSDIGGVIAGIRNHDELMHAAKTIQERVRARHPAAQDIFLLQEQIIGSELIIGMKRDGQFGPVLMFGLGGIFVEVFKDVSFRIAPVSKKDALDMISEIKGSKILAGARGGKAVDQAALSDIIVKISKLSMDHPEIAEIDLNPVIVNDRKALVADARIMGDPK